jgi:SAM-dependent methyltransferase
MALSLGPNNHWDNDEIGPQRPDLDTLLDDPTVRANLIILYKNFAHPAYLDEHFEEAQQALVKNLRELVKSGVLAIEFLMALKNIDNIVITSNTERDMGYNQAVMVGDTLFGLISEDPTLKILNIGQHYQYDPYSVHPKVGMLKEIRESGSRISVILTTPSTGIETEPIPIKDLYIVKDMGSPNFDAQAHNPEFDWIQLAWEVDQSHVIIAQKLEAEIEPGDHVADIGAGPGFSASHLRNSGAHFHLLDGSPKMLRAGEALDIENLVAERILHKIDGETALPLDNESMDHVISNGTLYYTYSLKHTLLEIARVLKTGGTLHFSFRDCDKDPAQQHLPQRLGGGYRLPLMHEPLVRLYRKHPELLAIEDGYLDHESAKWVNRVEFRHRLEDVIAILGYCGLEVSTVSKHLVHEDPSTEEGIEFTYISCRKIR